MAASLFVQFRVLLITLTWATVIFGVAAGAKTWTFLALGSSDLYGTLVLYRPFMLTAILGGIVASTLQMIMQIKPHLQSDTLTITVFACILVSALSFLICVCLFAASSGFEFAIVACVLSIQVVIMYIILWLAPAPAPAPND